MFPAWAEAARIVFCFLPNSAMSERVFALVKNLFGDDQLSSLADMLQASLMLNANEHKVGWCGIQACVRVPSLPFTLREPNFDHTEYFMTFAWRGNGRAKYFFVILGLTFACFCMTLGYDICLAASGYL